MADNIIQKKSFDFAIRIVNTCMYLQKNKREFVLSKQLLRSGTSIGANVAESIGAQTKPDFIYKFSVAYKEAKETLYWIELLKATESIETALSQSLIKDIEEICRIISKILTTSKSK